MTPAEFRAARKTLWRTQDEAAAALGYGGARAISALENGERAVSGTLEILVLVYLSGRLNDWTPGGQVSEVDAQLAVLKAELAILRRWKEWMEPRLAEGECILPSAAKV